MCGLTSRCSNEHRPPGAYLPNGLASSSRASRSGRPIGLVSALRPGLTPRRLTQTFLCTAASHPAPFRHRAFGLSCPLAPPLPARLAFAGLSSVIAPPVSGRLAHPSRVPSDRAGLSGCQGPDLPSSSCPQYEAFSLPPLAKRAPECSNSSGKSEVETSLCRPVLKIPIIFT